VSFERAGGIDGGVEGREDSSGTTGDLARRDRAEQEVAEVGPSGLRPARSAPTRNARPA